MKKPSHCKWLGFVLRMDRIDSYTFPKSLSSATVVADAL